MVVIGDGRASIHCSRAGCWNGSDVPRDIGGQWSDTGRLVPPAHRRPTSWNRVPPPASGSACYSVTRLWTPQGAHQGRQERHGRPASMGRPGDSRRPSQTASGQGFRTLVQDTSSVWGAASELRARSYPVSTCPCASVSRSPPVTE